MSVSFISFVMKLNFICVFTQLKLNNKLKFIFLIQNDNEISIRFGIKYILFFYFYQIINNEFLRSLYYHYIAL